MFKPFNFICTGEILEKRKQESIRNIKNRLLPGSKNPDGLVDLFFFTLNAVSYRSTASQVLILFEICLKYKICMVNSILWFDALIFIFM